MTFLILSSSSMHLTNVAITKIKLYKIVKEVKRNMNESHFICSTRRVDGMSFLRPHNIICHSNNGNLIFNLSLPDFEGEKINFKA